MRKSILLSLILVLAMALSGCGNSEETSTETAADKGENYVFVYYPEEDYITMSQEAYQLKQPDSIIPSVEEVMSVCLEAYEGRMESYSYMVDDDNNVTLEITMAGDCTKEYSLLTMAAVSDTLFQMDMVESVKITLMTTEGEAVDSKLILRNTFYHYASDRESITKRVTFYKAAADGEGLEALSGTLTMEDNVSMVENVIVKLEDINAIPEGTRVNSVSVVSGVCYLDLSQEFQESVAETKSDLVVYSVVNSLSGFNNISKVFITIDGEIIESYRGSVDLSKPLSFNSEIVK